MSRVDVVTQQVVIIPRIKKKVSELQPSMNTHLLLFYYFELICFLYLATISADHLGTEKKKSD